MCKNNNSIPATNEETERCGTLTAWQKELGIDKDTIGRRLSGFPSITGIAANGSVLNFYPECIVRQQCEDVLNTDLACANERGFFHQDGIRFGTHVAWAQELGLGAATVMRRLCDAPSISGKIKEGNVVKFFAEEVAIKRCKALIGTEHQADTSGFFELGGDEYGVINALARLLNVPEPTLNRRMKGADYVFGKDIGGRVYKFYKVETARKLCDEASQDIPVADSTGCFTHEKLLYTTAYRFAQDYPVSEKTVQKRMKDIESLKGKDGSKRIRNFYPVDLMRMRCSDLLGTK